MEWLGERIRAEWFSNSNANSNRSEAPHELSKQCLDELHDNVGLKEWILYIFNENSIIEQNLFFFCQHFQIQKNPGKHYFQDTQSLISSIQSKQLFQYYSESNYITLTSIFYQRIKYQTFFLGQQYQVKAMVQMGYKVSCSCGASLTDYNESGDSDRWMSEFSCSHFRCSRYHSSKLGWAFGSNAWVSVAFQAHCKSCSSSSSWEHTYWGYSRGDTCTKSKSCHGYTITVYSWER